MMRMYAIVDRKASHIVNVFTSINDESARRSFEFAITEPDDNIFSQYPGDFELYFLCNLVCKNGEEFDIDSDNLIVADNCNLVAAGSSYSSAVLNSMRLERSLRRDARINNMRDFITRLGLNEKKDGEQNA